MFTGLVQSVGSLVSLEGGRMIVACPSLVSAEDPIQMGESIAINGCCLTVVTHVGDNLGFDLSEETLRLTTFGGLPVGSRVNLERAARIGDRLGGHIVQGHVDQMGTFLGVEITEHAHICRFSIPGGSRYLISKGSICIDGISLTVVDPTGDEFKVWVIPHTWAETNLSSLRVGDAVNAEFDMIAKHLEKLSSAAINR